MAPRDLINVILSDDLLLNILSRIEKPVERQLCSVVCKRWLWLLSATCRAIRVLRVAVIPSLLLRYANVTSLDCSSCVQISDSDVRAIASTYRSQLRHLDISNNKRITEMSLQTVGEFCEGLQSLRLQKIPLPDVAMMAVAQCRNLQVLMLTKCREISDVGLSCIAAGCKNLLDLSLKWCVGVTDKGIVMLVANCLQLRTLDLSDTRVTGIGLQAVAQLPALHFLNLAQCSFVDNSALAALQTGCSSLMGLDLTGCTRINETGALNFIRVATQLEQLIVSHCHQLADATLLYLSKLPSLRVLKVERCSITNSGLLEARAASEILEEICFKRCPVMDCGVQSFITGCGNLLHLDLTCCQSISDSTLFVLAENCRFLETLLLENCLGITAAGLASVASGCPNLHTLDCTDCSLGDSDVEGIAKIQNLQTLKLGFSVKVTNCGLAYLRANCGSLRHLDLYRCEQIGDEGITALLEGCHSLTEVNLSYTSVTDEGLLVLTHCRDIVNVELRGCLGITSIGLTHIAGVLPHLTDLDLKHCYKVGDKGMLAIAENCKNLRQINLSFCPVTNIGLDALTQMACIGNMKLVHCKNLMPLETARALARCEGLQKLKLELEVQDKIPVDVIAMLEDRGCVIRWMDKPQPPW